MKKIVSLFSFLLFVGAVSVSAQENTNPENASVEVATKKACDKTAKACAATCAAKAAKAASMSEDIEKSVCPASGKVSYKRKSVCEKSGKVSYSDVRYDEASATFVNLEETSEVKAAEETRGKKKACSPSCKKKCSKGAAKAKAMEEKAGA